MNNRALFDRVMAQLSSEYTDVVIMPGVYTKDFALELAALIEALNTPAEDCVVCWGEAVMVRPLELETEHAPDCALIALLKALDGEPT